MRSPSNNKMFNRSDRVSSLIHSELSQIILKEVEFPPGVLVTIASLDLDKKMERAIIGVSVIPSDKSDVVLKMLCNRTGYLQMLLLRKINIKPMPQLVFAIDKGYEHAANIEKLLIEQ
mgnify:CR=1 FL=1